MSGTIWVRGGETYWVASVAELPGCVASGTSRDDAVANARRAFGSYLELLEARGIATDEWKQLDPASFAVEESSAAAVLPDDVGPLDEHGLRDHLHRMEASRAALLAQVRGLTAEEMERKPTPSMWSVREVLEHVMQTEVTFLSRLEKWPASEFATLQAVHRMAFQRFTVMDPEDTAIDHEILGRRWSTRKVMRRMLEHEYEHLEHIREIVTALGGDRPPE